MDREVRKQERYYALNYLKSIDRDAEFVTQVVRANPGIPVVANLRNGLWYAPDCDAAAYFMSKDGHTNNWDFSMVRLNLHVLRLIVASGGAILVDSTRRGKVSKTEVFVVAVSSRGFHR